MGTKKCQFCAEEILEEAIKCKHCGSMLSEQPSAVAEAPPQDQSSTIGTTDIRNPKIGKGKQLVGLGLFMLGILFFFAGGSEIMGGINIGTFVILVGLILYVVGRGQNWWHWK